MKTTTLFATLALSLAAQLPAQVTGPGVPQGLSFVDYDAFEKLTAEVKAHRQSRLLPLDDFLEASKEPNTIILDTRSLEMYNRKHLKGAKNLAFADFTQANLAKVVPSFSTKILIYCNNNYAYDPESFATKEEPMTIAEKPVTLALNIPTYINLYGYGYKNVYELLELVSVNDPRLEFEGAFAGKPLAVDTLMSWAGAVPSSAVGSSPFVDFSMFETLTADVKKYRKDRLLDLDAFLAAAKDPNTIILDTRADSLYKRKHIKGAVHLEFSDFTISNLKKVIPSHATRVLIYCNNNFYIPENWPALPMIVNISAYVDQLSFATKIAMPSPVIDWKVLVPVTEPPKAAAFTVSIPPMTALPSPAQNKISESVILTMAEKMQQEQRAKAIKKQTQATASLASSAAAAPAAAPVIAPQPAPPPAQQPITLALNIPTFINLYGYNYQNVYELSELVDMADPRLEFEGTQVR